MEESAVELHRVMGDREMKRVVLLIYANKKDILGSIGHDQVKSKLKLDELRGETLWHIQTSCATTGDGLVEGLDWLVEALDQTR